MEELERFELAPYFGRRVVNDPERHRRVWPHAVETGNDPEETAKQPDGKARHWRYVPDLGHQAIIAGA